MKKTLLFYSLAIVTAATAMAGLRHTQKAPAALDAKLEALTAKPHSPSLREIGSEIVLVSEDFAKFTAGSEDDPDGTELSDWNDGTIDAKYTQQPGWRGGFVYQAGGCAYLGVSRNLVGINFRHPNVMPNFAVWKTITYRHWHKWCCQPRF